MIKITDVDLDSLERIKSGRYGTVFRKDQHTAYKIYHPTLYTSYGMFANPCLALPKYRYRMLIERSRDMQYTKSVQDLITYHHEFGGVAIPFYEGPMLYENMDRLSIPEKVGISRKIVRNGKELSNHSIYCTDFKLDNIIMCHGEPQFIDLDDILTHVCVASNPIHYLTALNGLYAAICTFFGDDYHLDLPHSIDKQLGRNIGFPTCHYSDIEVYLHHKEKERQFLLVDSSCNMDEVKRILRGRNLHVVYLIDPDKQYKKEDYQKIIDTYRARGIALYDFLPASKIDSYPNIENTRSMEDTQHKIYYKK